MSLTRLMSTYPWCQQVPTFASAQPFPIVIIFIFLSLANRPAHLCAFYLWQIRPAHLYTFDLWQLSPTHLYTFNLRQLSSAHLHTFCLRQRLPVQLRKPGNKYGASMYFLSMAAAAIVIAEMFNLGNKAYLYTFNLWQQLPAHLYIFIFGCGIYRVTLSFCAPCQHTL